MEVLAPSLSSLGFQKLSPLLLYSPGEPQDQPTPDIGKDVVRYDLVMVWGWMNASPRHLFKYLQLHRSLQPGVPIIFMQSTTASFMGFTNSLRGSFPSIYDIVKILPENPNIHAHTFSNGGASGFSQFLAFYRYQTGVPMPLKSLIIDSAPGDTKFPSALTRGVNAFMEVVRNHIIRSILYPLAYFLVTIIYLPPMLIGLENPIDSMRRTLNDETLVQEGGTRGYVFCEGDAMVAWEGIVEHADQAEDRGWKVLKKRFAGGSHVGGYRHHPEEYEEFVRQIRNSI
ncbi:hypothetical protein TWF694_003326 [Orbilia ellipsospora]|uniref:Indole-diterpene biosynthesis protein PaxU n=1 Tax=Orbilia ellipsospora TaxID=2528407 RepID=A0AAV9X2G0_9PEZI